MLLDIKAVAVTLLNAKVAHGVVDSSMLLTIMTNIIWMKLQGMSHHHQ